MATDYRWKLLRVGLDRFAHYRDGMFMFTRTSTQIRMDGRFYRKRAELMGELDNNGVAIHEIPKGNISQAG
jgi:hypothetical protein